MAKTTTKTARSGKMSIQLHGHVGLGVAVDRNVHDTGICAYICSRSAHALRPAGGVKHSDSDLVETRMLSAKKALRWIEGSILSKSGVFVQTMHKLPPSFPT